MKSYIVDKFEKFDTWICTSLPVLSIRLWWCRLWIRKNEFHASLYTDMQILLSLKDTAQKEFYIADVQQRKHAALSKRKKELLAGAHLYFR